MANELEKLQSENIGMRRQIDEYQAKDKEFSELTEEEFKELVQRNPRVKSLYDKSVAKGAHSTAQNELAKMKTEQAPDPAPEIDARADRLDRKERALALAIEKNLDPEQAFALLGLDADSTDETRLDAAADIRQAGRNEFLKANGRTPHVSLNMSPIGLAELERMPDSMLEKVPGEVLDRAHAEMMDQGKKTLRERISTGIFGGKK